MTEQKLIDEFLVHGTIEFMDLKWMSWITRELHPKDESDVISLTVDTILYLLENNLAIAGDPVKDEQNYVEIKSWDLTPAEAVERIEREWRELGSFIDSGKVVWLELTDIGRAKGLELAEKPS